MKIDSFAVNTNSQRTSSAVEYTSSRFTTIASEAKSYAPKQDANLAASADDDAVKLDMEDILDEAAQNAQKFAKKASESAGTKVYSPKKAMDLHNVNNADDLRLSLLEEMIFALTGRRIKLQPLRIEMGDGSQAPQNFSIPSGSVSGRAAAQDTYVVSEHFVHESESVSYTAQGTINTADGKSISIDLEMNMSRSYTSYSQSAVKQQRVICDPLVVNYGGTAASLTGATFKFDLDFDGKADNIHFAGEGSGFLALDKNGDGQVNDGSELFGPATGSGFGELRAYDEDGNSWIDENDAIFSHLRIWSKDKDGNDQLFALKDLDIGAIYLGETSTEFSFKGAGNSTQGVMRSTSFFLKESTGEAGTVNHIDLAL